MIEIIFISNTAQLKNTGNINNSTILVSANKLLENKCREKYPNADIIPLEYLINDFKWQDCLTEEKRIFDCINDIEINGKKIFKELGYKGISFLKIDAERYLSGHRNVIANLLLKLYLSESIITNLKPKKLVISHPFSSWENALINVCEKRDLEVEEISSSFISNLFKIDYFDLFNPLIPSYLKFKNILFFRTKKRTSKNEILIFIINKKYLDVLLPLIESIESDKKFKSLVIVPKAYFDGENLLKENNIHYEYIESYLTKDVIFKSNKLYNNVLNNYKNSKDEIVSAMANFTSSFVNQSIMKEIDKTFIFSLNFIRYIFLIKEVVKKNDSKILINMHFAETMINALTLGCKDISIPVIGMHRGTSFWQPEHSIFLGDKLLVAGNRSKEIFECWGVDSLKIEITGFPLFDHLFEKLKSKKAIKKQIKTKLDLKGKYKIVTYLTQSLGSTFDHQMRRNEIEIVFEAIKQIKNVFLIVKIHPTESETKIYDEIAAEKGLKNYAVIYDDILDELLISSDIALTKSSTAGFNALIADCRLIILDFFNNSTNNFFLESNVAQGVKNLDELIEYLKLSLSVNNISLNTASKEFLEYHFYNMDQKSVDRIKNNIYKLMSC